MMRFGAGKVSDRHGRTNVILAGLIVTAIALFVISEGTTINMLLIEPLYGMGTGVLSPAINAWTIDLSNPRHRGKAIATMYISMEIGIGCGALLGGSYYNDVIQRIPQIFKIDIVFFAIGIVYLLYWKKKTAVKNVEII